ncbi:MAG TPA: thioredoxin domain-containing protein [Solirubrobacteraceae bacterium]|nr:thioredoxin domain-containing protein [Solirubrobacteraceae bacterium]
MANRLARETSAYLLQHAENPVDWYPWGEEAFARARDEDRAILVSIGYSACHWCHVMERESFEDAGVAKLMNERFVCIKVDREEHPDVDAIYMDAVQAMTGHGGWPLNAFLTPTGIPFWAGTYFPPEPRQGMPSWPQVLNALGTAWDEQREEIRSQAGAIVPRLRGAAALKPPEAEIDPGSLDTAVASLRKLYDAEHGGFGGAPKFPPASAIDFLLGRGEREMALHTLRRMASGGMYDQIGGGFSRYSVDRTWLVPHFEKMLYDNALLARAYLHAWQVTGEPLFERVCRETLDWALAELRQEEGGFASALDADSEGVEGKFYVWTLAEVHELLGDELGTEAIEHFGMTERGNFEGANIPVRATPDPSHRDELRSRLYRARARRVWPGLDDKRLTGWNALMISALADAAAAFDDPAYRSAAVECADFLVTRMRDADGRLLRTYNRGQARLRAVLEDHAFLLEALLTLYEATFDAHWFAEARALADTIIERFADPEHGGFFSTADDHAQLIARRKDIDDNPIPAGQSAAALGLLRLSALTGEHRYEEAALGVLQLLHTIAPEHPAGFGHLLQAIDFHVSPVREVALVGPDLAPLERVVRSTYRPRIVVAGGEPDGVPLLAGREPVDGRAAAYVCERFACRRPVTEPDELAALLD